MKNQPSKLLLLLNLFLWAFALALGAQDEPFIEFDFNQRIKNGTHAFTGKAYSFTSGIENEALLLTGGETYPQLESEGLTFDGEKDFSIQCWVKTSSKKPMVFLAQKEFNHKGILAQLKAGWALYSSGGTFAWTVGSGTRRVNYERENGNIMPINDGRWHQLTITYSAASSEFRLYYDGHNTAIYTIGFDFSNTQPLTIGSARRDFDYDHQYAPDIEKGRSQLQLLVDQFNELGVGSLQKEEFLDLIVEPEELLKRKLALKGNRQEPDKNKFSKTLAIRKELTSNPYTVYQNRSLTLLKPISKLYALNAGKIVLDDTMAKYFTARERLYPADFAMDGLSLWKKTLSASAILESYNKIQATKAFKLKTRQKQLTIGVWNIWHGGIHWSSEKDGWDSRLRIVEMLKKKKADVILMQETYSSGDFIAAELGYYFATTSDWDYRFQGSNISVLSRYPIEEIKVSTKTEFNNVAVKLAISKTQKVWAMSNWYGMQQFPDVFNFHESRFATSEAMPVFFGGDFNAVPHTDGGDSPASKKLLGTGFIDAFRSLYPEVKKHPGLTHRSKVRIDQLYYKGTGIENRSTEVISAWPSGFPSDHYLILSKFKLKR